MFKINKKVEYALIALKHMDCKGEHELTSVKEICEHYGAPFDVTSRAMQKMTSSGLLRSEKGAQGGYALKRSLEEVRLLDLIEMVLGPVAVAKCVEGSSCGLLETCNIISPINTLNDKMRDFFRMITVKELIKASTCGTHTEEALEVSGS